MSNELARNLAAFIGLGIAYNVWILIFDWSVFPYLAITILNGVVGYYLFVGPPVQKRINVALVPACILIYPLLSGEDSNIYMGMALAQMLIIGLIVVQLWEVLLYFTDFVINFKSTMRNFRDT